MNRTGIILRLLALATFAMWSGLDNDAWCQEFRVDSRVFRLGQDKPVSTCRTYVTNDAFYDMTVGGQSTIIDRKTESITIVDPQRRLTCRISADHLFHAVAAFTARVADKPPMIRFAASPHFEEKWSEDTELLEMAGGPLSYVVETIQPEDAAVARAYLQFADWSARLNVTRLGGLPPQARLVVNAKLAALGRLPAKVTLVRQFDRSNFFSTHEYHWTLNPGDFARMSELSTQAKEFEIVDLVQLRLAKSGTKTSKQ